MTRAQEARLWWRLAYGVARGWRHSVNAGPYTSPLPHDRIDPDAWRSISSRVLGWRAEEGVTRRVLRYHAVGAPRVSRATWTVWVRQAYPRRPLPLDRQPAGGFVD